MAAQETPLLGYRPKLLNRVEVAEGTMAFYLERPSGFDFKPGQTADFTLMNPPETDSEGNTRTFSIASAPFENELMFVTRMRDTAFKRSLKVIPLGTELQMSHAMGSFTLHKNSAKPAVFLAGGIGVTPFFSIVRQADRDRMSHRLYFFYSNHRPEDAPFLAVKKSGKDESEFLVRRHNDRHAAIQEIVGRRDRFHQKGNVVEIPKQLTGTCLLHRRSARYGCRYEGDAGNRWRRRG